MGLHSYIRPLLLFHALLAMVCTNAVPFLTPAASRSSSVVPVIASQATPQAHVCACKHCLGGKSCCCQGTHPQGTTTLRAACDSPDDVLRATAHTMPALPANTAPLARHGMRALTWAPYRPTAGAARLDTTVPPPRSC